jgi:hypothetical protein
MAEAAITALALDHAPIATGWAVGRPCEPPLGHGVFRLRTWGLDEPDRVARYRTWLMDLIANHRIGHVFYEQPIESVARHGNLDTRMKQGAVVGMIWLACHDAGVPCQPVAVSQWRARFLGTTKATPGLKGVHEEDDLKAKALRACALRGLIVSDHNEAEALGILDYGLSTLSRRHAAWGDPLMRRAQLPGRVG